MEIETNKLFTVEVKQDVLGYKSFAAAYAALMEKNFKNEANYVHYYIRWDSPGQWANFKDEKGTSWTKRFSAHIYNDSGHKMDKEALSLMGSVLNDSLKDETLHFQIAKYSDWSPGDFGEIRGSCWWGDYDASRKGLVKDPRGYAVLYYDSPDDFRHYGFSKGKGRHWLVDLGDRAVIFNAYGVSLSTAADGLAKLWDKTASKIDIISEGSYINKGNKNNEGEGGIAGGGEIGYGFIIADKDYPRTHKENIGDIRLKDGQCERCKKELIRRSSYQLPGGKYICYNCVDELPKCGHCDHPYMGDGTEVRYNRRTVTVCSTCLSRYCNPCEVHGIVLGSTHRVWHTNRCYCGECVDNRKAAVCMCGKITDKYVRIGRTVLCSSCVRKLRKDEVKYEGHRA